MLALLAEMRRKQLEANVITFSAACSACEKGLRWAEAGVLRRCRGRHGGPRAAAGDEELGATAQRAPQ